MVRATVCRVDSWQLGVSEGQVTFVRTGPRMDHILTGWGIQGDSPCYATTWRTTHCRQAQSMLCASPLFSPTRKWFASFSTLVAMSWHVWLSEVSEGFWFKPHSKCSKALNHQLLQELADPILSMDINKILFLLSMFT